MWMFGPAMLALEAQQVIALRLARMACGGPAAVDEAQRMVSEKMHAGAKVAGMMSAAMLRGSPDGGTADVVSMLRREVRANRRRLSR